MSQDTAHKSESKYTTEVKESHPDRWTARIKVTPTDKKAAHQVMDVNVGRISYLISVLGEREKKAG